MNYTKMMKNRKELYINFFNNYSNVNLAIVMFNQLKSKINKNGSSKK